MVELRGRKVIEARATNSGIEEGGPYSFVVTQPGAVTHFSACVEQRSGETLFISLPEELHQAGFRDSIRTGLPSTGRAMLVCPHPRLPDELITRPLLDLSARGFAFKCDPESDLLFPGDRLEQMEITFPDKLYRAAGTIRGIAPHQGSHLYSCGVEIVGFAEAADEQHWRERVFKHAHPRIVLPDNPRGTERAWSVLESSGYVSLWADQASKPDLPEKFRRFWDQAPSEVGRLLLLESNGATVATMAGNLLFPRTWLIHHFGVDKTQRASPATFLGFAREMYAALMYVLQHVAPLEYFVIYVEKDKRWTQALYGDFVERYAPAADSQYGEVRVFKCSPSEPRTLRIRRGPGPEVVLADEAALRSLSQHLRATLSKLEFDAFAYDEENIDLAAFAAQCQGHSYDRARHVYLALKDGVAVAALMAESGEEGANLFGLMNRCRLFALGPAGIDPVAKQALLSAASAHYAALGKYSFVFLGGPDEDIAELQDIGYDFVSEGIRWLARRSVVPAWLSFVQNSLAG
jgi:hypothetical protein